jgi:hypothetical protein
MERYCIDGLDASSGCGRSADGRGCDAACQDMAGTKTSGAGGLYPNGALADFRRKMFAVLLMKAAPSQELEPAAHTVRFTFES